MRDAQNLCALTKVGTVFKIILILILIGPLRTLNNTSESSSKNIKLFIMIVTKVHIAQLTTCQSVHCVQVYKIKAWFKCYVYDL